MKQCTTPLLYNINTTKYKSVVDLEDGYYFVVVDDNLYRSLPTNEIEKLVGFVIKVREE